MNQTISTQTIKKLVGKKVYAVKKDGTFVIGTLRRKQGNQFVVESQDRNKAQIKLFTPLVLFDLLAIGTYGGYGGFGYPGYGLGYGGFGYPGAFIW